MSAFARASVLALKGFSAANASIIGDSIVYRDLVDMSVAVSTLKCLVTSVLRNAEAMGFLDIENGISARGKKAGGAKLTIEAMASGSFTMYFFTFCFSGYVRVGLKRFMTARIVASSVVV